MYFRTNTTTNKHVISCSDMTQGNEITINNAEYETLKGLSWINYSNTNSYNNKYEFGDLTGLGKIILEKIINKGE